MRLLDRDTIRCCHGLGIVLRFSVWYIHLAINQGYCSQYLIIMKIHDLRAFIVSTILILTQAQRTRTRGTLTITTTSSIASVFALSQSTSPPSTPELFDNLALRLPNCPYLAWINASQVLGCDSWECACEEPNYEGVYNAAHLTIERNCTRVEHDRKFRTNGRLKVDADGL